MKVVYPALPSGHVIFCDDIRQEINGKITFVGTYTNFMFINGSLPIMLPKLCMGIVYREEVDANEPVTIKIFLPSDDESAPHAEFQMPSTTPDMLTRPPSSGDDLTFKEARLFYEAPGVVISQEGRIKVRAYRGDKEIRLGALVVSVNPDQKTDSAEKPQEDEAVKSV